MKKQKVIIIGAGPAGLTAAYSLLSQSKEYDVTIIEETNDIGGISKTVKYKNNKMDIGGHRFFSKNDEVNKFWNNIMPIQGQKSYDDKILERNITLKEGGPDPEKENNVMLIRKRVSRIYYLNKFYDYPITLKKETFTNLGLKTTIQSGFSYIKSTIYKRKENSLEDFYINRFGKKLYSIFFEKYTEKLWGRNPNIISPDFGKQRVKGLSIKEIFKDIFHLKRKETETSLIKEFYYPKYGPGQFWERVAEEIEKLGGKIILNSKVIKINSKNNKITSIIYDNNKIKKEINGDIFISSMPLKDLINSFSAKTPTKIKKIASGLPYRDFITIGLLVKK
jgi:protoporphyrinogen oxidase